MILELLFVLANVALAFWHYHLIKKNIAIKHGLWALIYGGLVIIAWLAEGWLIALCTVLIREVVFSPVLNLLRKKPFFYYNSIPNDGSKLDDLEGKYIPYIYFGSLIILIVLQFFL